MNGHLMLEDNLRVCQERLKSKHGKTSFKNYLFLISSTYLVGDAVLVQILSISVVEFLAPGNYDHFNFSFLAQLIR